MNTTAGTINGVRVIDNLSSSENMQKFLQLFGSACWDFSNPVKDLDVVTFNSDFVDQTGD